MPYNPFDDNPYLNSIYPGLRMRRPVQEPSFPALPQEEEESLLASVTNKALGGLGYLGQILDKPGRSIRGLLAGKPRELLNILPFASAAGLTREEDYTSGRDLLEMAGALGANEEGLDAGDVAGFGVDVVTDPLSWLSGPLALTKLGTAAKKIGVGAGTLREGMAGLKAGTPEIAQLASATGRSGAELAGQPLRQLLGTGGLSSLLGFGGTPLLTGEAGAKTLDYLSTAAGLAGKVPGIKQVVQHPLTARLGSGLATLFRPERGGIFNDELARYYEKNIGPALEKAEFGVREGYVGSLKEAGQAGYRGGAVEDLVRAAAEGNLPSGVAQGTAESAAIAKGLEHKALNAAKLAEQHEWGIPVKELEGYGQPRYKSDASVGTGKFGRKQLDPSHPSMIAREAAFKGPYRNLPTQTIEDILHDPIAAGADKSSARDAIMDIIAGKQLVPGTAEYQAAFRQASDLAGFAGGVGLLTPEQRFFGSALENQARGTMFADRAIATSKGVHGFIAESMRPMVDLGAEGVPLDAALFDKMGLGHKVLTTAGELSAPMAKLSELTGKSVEELSQYGMPADLANAVTKLMRPMSTPEAMRPFLEVFDAGTNILKKLLTVVFPGFHVRNMGTVVWQNTVGGIGPETLLEAKNVLSGAPAAGMKDIPAFAGAGLDDVGAMQRLAEGAYARKLIVHGVSQIDASLTGGAAREMFEGLGTTLPGEPGWLPMTAGKTFNPIKQGEAAARYVDAMGRMSAYIGFLKQGFTEDMAAGGAKALHYDYAAMTPFDKAVWKRLFPFWAWTKKNSEFFIKSMLSDPALPQAGIRVGTSLRDPNTFIPGFIGEGIGLPMAGAPEGHQRYLSSLGLPIEDEPIKALGSALHGEPSRAVGQLLSQLHPALKYPIELATGTQLFTGRRLEDLKPSTLASGLSLGSEDTAGALSQFISNTPASRASTVIDKLMDTLGPNARKGAPETALNLLTGARLTDVDVERQREIAASKIIESQLKGHKGVKVFTRPYAKVADIPNLAPEDILLLRLQTGLEKRARERIKVKTK